MAGAAVPQPDDWEKYKVQPSEQKDDWSQYAVPKKAGGAGSPLTSPPSSNGSNNFQSFLQPTETNLSPVTDPVLKQHIQQTQAAQVQHVSELLHHLRGIYNNSHTEKEIAAQNAIPDEKDKLQVNTPEQLKQQKAMDTTLGKIEKSTEYVGSQALHGGTQVLKGGAWVLNHLNTSLTDTQTIPDSAFKGIDKFDDLGVTPGQKSQIEDDKGLGMGATRTLGMLANIAPAAVGGEYAELPKTVFALQGFGQGQETMDAVDPEHKLNPAVRDLYIAGNGAVNGIIMGDLKENVLSKPVQDKIVSAISADALKETVEKGLSEDAYKEVLQKTTDKFITKAGELLNTYAEKTGQAAKDFSALQAANYVLKKGVDVTSDHPVFNANLGQLMSDVSDVVTKQAPVFGGIGAMLGGAKADPTEATKQALSDQIQQLTDTPADGIIAEKEKAVRLKDLNKQLDEVVTNQYDQQKDRASGKKITYSKGVGEDDGKFFKTVDGKPEEITESRYKLEKPDKNEKDSNDTQENVGQETDGKNGQDEKVLATEEKVEPVTGEATAEPVLNEQKGEQDNATQKGNITENSEQQHPGTASGENIQSDGSEIREEKSGQTSGSNSVEPKEEKPLTGIRNEDVSKERGENVPRTEKTREETDAEGKRLVDSGELDPDEFAKKIIDKPRPASTEEQAALRYHKVNLEKEQRTLAKDPTPENEIEYAKNEDRLESNRKATEIIGNELGRGLGDRQGQMAEDYSRVHILERAKMANGGELNPNDQKELETRTKRIKDLEGQLADREEQIRKLHEQNTVANVHRAATFEERTAKRETTRTSLRKEREDLVANLHLIAKKSLGTLGANKIPVEMLAPLAKLARNYVLDGALTISQVADKILNDLKDVLPNVTKSDIEDAVKDNFDKYLSEQNQIRLDRARKRQLTKLYDLKSGNYEKKVQSKIQVDNDYLKIRADINREQTLINKKIDDIQNSKKSWNRKAVDFAVKYGRQAKLASVTVLGKLAATGLTTMGLKGATEGVGAGFSKLLPRIAKKSTVEGGFNVKQLAQSYAKAATQGMKDAAQEVKIKKGGQSDLSALYGKYISTKLPAEAADFLGHLHSAIKAPIKRQAWEYSYAKRVAKIIEQGLDPQDPIIDATNRLNAYKDAERAIFMGDNKISQLYESSMKTLENSNSSTARTVAALSRILLPFVKVPTNIVLSTGRYAFGLVPGAAKLAQIGTSSALRAMGAENMAKVIHSGMGELTPEESDMVLRNLKHGTVGGAALLIGFFNPKNVGGFYQPGEKRNKKDANVGALKIYGQKMPAFLTEHPIFQAMQIGATFRRFLDAHRHQEGNISAATLATAAGLAKGIPLANEANNLLDILNSKNDHKLNTFIAKTAKGEIEPAAIDQLAQAIDTRNGSDFTINPDNMVEREADRKHGLVKETKQELESGIPGLRKNIPRKH